MKSPLIVYLVLAAVPCWSGCTEDTPDAIGPDPCRTFSTSLTVKDRMNQSAAIFTAGEPITFDLQITNTANAPATLTAGSSCTAVVFEVVDAATKQRFWGSADGIACIQMLQPRTYAPYETTANASTWNQQGTVVGNSVTLVPPGAYTVTANVGQYMTNSAGQTFDCRAPLSKSATLTIR